MTKAEVKPAEGYGFPAELLTPISPITQLYTLSQMPVSPRISLCLIQYNVILSTVAENEC